MDVVGQMLQPCPFAAGYFEWKPHKKSGCFARDCMFLEFDNKIFATIQVWSILKQEKIYEANLGKRGKFGTYFVMETT